MKNHKMYFGIYLKEKTHYIPVTKFSLICSRFIIVMK